MIVFPREGSNHMEPLVKGLWNGFEKNHAYALSLIEDLSDDQMIAQPAFPLPKAMNHAAWVVCHLKTYRPAIAALLSGSTVDDPLDHPYGMKSSPLLDRNAYPAKAEIVRELEQTKEMIHSALSIATASTWERTLPIERWQTRWGCVGVAVSYLMLNHESLHLGQLSAWRRALGLPPVKS
jgi:hypothetical protein